MNAKKDSILQHRLLLWTVTVIGVLVVLLSIIQAVASKKVEINTPTKNSMQIDSDTELKAVSSSVSNINTTQPTKDTKKEANQNTEPNWKEILTEDQYYIMREEGTERPGSSPLNDEKRAGTYYDATGTYALFRSEDKFDSGTGWPSFTKPINEGAVKTKTDWSIGFPRTEVVTANYEHHLGHVFKDGPEPTGLRYCINGDALKFVPDEQ